MNGSVNPLTTKLYRVRKTVFKMLTKRGYSVDDNDMNMTLDTFLRELCDAEGNPNLNNMTIPARRIDSDDDNDRIVVFFIRGNDKKINGKEFEAKVAQMATDHVKRVILVFGGELTSDAKKKLASSSTAEMVVEGFLEDELVVDITEHELVPEHQLLTPVEKSNLLKQYGLEERQLPRIQKSDPIARYFGAQRGQVFRIVRKSETAGKYVTYRIVDS